METFKINYKSDFVLRLASDAGWGTAFTLEFWSNGAPTKRYYATHDGNGNYTNCKPDSDTELRVMFDDHGLGIGNLMLRITYSLADEEFRTGKDDEVVNVAAITVLNDEGEEVNVMLNLEGETAAEVQYSLPLLEAEKNRQNAEAQRNINETQRIAEEQKRETAETLRNQAELDRQASEDVRKSYERAREAAEQQRQTAEAARVGEFETNEAARKETFETNEAERQAIFDANEAERQVLYEKVAKNTENIAELGTQVIYDVSANNDGVTFASLSALLSDENLSTLIPTAVRCGGMSIRFIQSSDNKYMQYRFMLSTFTAAQFANEANWQEINDNFSVAETQRFAFGISDEEGNTVVQFKEGHIKTKNFDSSEDATVEHRGLMSSFDKQSIINNIEKLRTIEEGAQINDVNTINNYGSDMVFSDEEGNTVVQFKEGHIKTKNFDSKNTVDISRNFDGTIKSYTEENPIKAIKEAPGLSAIIQNWGFIGDSLMSGVANNNIVETGDLVPMPRARNFYKYSWGQMMCRLTGAFGTNYSDGGQTAKGWLNEYPENTVNRYNSDGTWPVSFSTTHKVAYAINFGTNDTNNFDTLYPGGVGSMQNVHISSSDYTSDDLDTYAGCYGKIISLCKEVSPSSRIFLITTPSIEYKNNTDILQFERDLVDSDFFTHVYLVDLQKYMIDGDSIRNIYGNGHLFCQGYMYYAFCVMNYIDYIIRMNPTDFANIQFIEYLKEDSGQA